MVQLNLPTSHLAPSSSSQIEPLDQWGVGEELFKNEDQDHDLLDRDLRLFVEECDQIQGFQVLAGADDVWAGFLGRYLERLRDEYGRKSIWVWGAEDDSEGSSRVSISFRALSYQTYVSTGKAARASRQFGKELVTAIRPSLTIHTALKCSGSCFPSIPLCQCAHQMASISTTSYSI